MIIKLNLADEDAQALIIRAKQEGITLNDLIVGLLRSTCE